MPTQLASPTMQSGMILNGYESGCDSVVSDVCSTVLSESEDEKPRKVTVGRNALPRNISFSAMMEVPRTDEGKWLSIGSKLHESRTCVPCKWFRSSKGCKDGVFCKHCHAAHEDLTRHAIRSKVRRNARDKRRLFEGGKLRQGFELPSVKNTFYHIDDNDDSSNESIPSCNLARSSSAGQLH
jgi:hypothetical protein